MIETLCQECNGPIQLPLLRSGRLPRFCGADCRKRAAARRESNRRATLTAAGICPRCKQSLPEKTRDGERRRGIP